jgi:hypothetical protein
MYIVKRDEVNDEVKVMGTMIKCKDPCRNEQYL